MGDAMGDAMGWSSLCSLALLPGYRSANRGKEGTTGEATCRVRVVWTRNGEGDHSGPGKSSSAAAKIASNRPAGGLADGSGTPLPTIGCRHFGQFTFTPCVSHASTQ